MQELLGSYFAFGIIPDRPITPAWSPVLVGVSFFIAVLAGLVFVSLVCRLSDRQASTNRLAWVAVGATIMGLGIWAMHFVGMVAYRLPVPVIYAPLITSLSAVPAIAASAITLHLVARPAVSMPRLVIGGVIFGIGIGTMHYTGMAAMKIDGIIRYDPLLFTISILVAPLLAIAALWVARRQLEAAGAHAGLLRLGAAVLVGMAVAGMHYTAMSSTLCYAGNASEDLMGVNPDLLASVTAIAIVLAGIAAILLDRRLAEEVELRRSAARHAEEVDLRVREALEAMQGSLALFDSSEKLVLCNSSFRETYGISNSQMEQGVSYDDILRKHGAKYLSKDTHRSESACTASQMRQARDTEQPISLETGGGSWSSIHQRRTGNGGTVLLRTDITKFRETQELLEQQSRRLQLVMDNVAEALVIIDEKGAIESLNRAAERIFGYSEAEIFGKHVSILMTKDTETGSASGNGLYRYLQGSTSDNPKEGQQLEFEGCNRNGETIYLEAMFSDVVEGRRRLHIGALRDISERKRNALALEKARLAAEQASIAKSEFISHMSHELRTPLNAVIGMSELLLTVDEFRHNDEKLREYLTDILVSGQHQLSLVNDILNLTAIESGGRAVSLTAFDIVPEIEGLVRTLQTVADKHGANLHLDLPGETIEVLADSQCFNQVTMNIIANAITHSGPGSDIRIGVLEGSTAEEICVLVADNGTGMPRELVEDLGQPFPQARNSYVRKNNSPNMSSTGLGFSISKQLLEMNGGRFEVESVLDEGTRVFLYWQRPKAPIEQRRASA